MAQEVETHEIMGVPLDSHGREEGKKEERLHVAINLLDVLDDATIAGKSGLPLEEVEKLRKSNKAIDFS
jgi:hypothetical protein